MKINDLVIEAHKNAVEHGWWDNKATMGELLALIHSEVSEALEEHRKGKLPNETYYSGKRKMNTAFKGQTYETTLFSDEIGHSRYIDGNNLVKCDKPEGIPSELADIVIRVFDMCGYYGIDLEAAIKEKMEYNKSRPYKHGGKTL